MHLIRPRRASALGCAAPSRRVTDAPAASDRREIAPSASPGAHVVVPGAGVIGSLDDAGTQVVVLPPGTMYVATTWSGAIWEQRPIPEACVVFPDCADHCVVSAGAPAGEYQFNAYAWTTCTGVPGVCDCASPSEPCVGSSGAMVSGEALMVSANIEVPAMSAVELVFQ